MIECYNFITVKISNEHMQARPVAWNKEIYDGFGNDVDGNPVKATEFEGTCPFCGNCIHFSLEDVYKDASKEDNVKCEICNAGNEAVKTVEEPVEEKKDSIQPNKTAFIDPIALGLFDLEVDMELLKKVDSAELS